MRAAVLLNNQVVTVVEATPPLAEGFVEAPEWVQAGDTYDPGTLAFSATLEPRRAHKLAEVEAAYRKARTRDITVGAADYACDEKDVLLLVQAVISDTPPATWEDAAGDDQTVAVQDLLEAVMTRQLAQMKKRKRLGRQIRQAASVEDLAAISW